MTRIIVLDVETTGKDRSTDQIVNAKRREYIMARSIPIPFAGCWLWLLSCGNHGYGNVSSSMTSTGRSGTAHRLSHEAFKGPIPVGMLVQHSCDNKWCVNPDHLSLGTDKTNSDDKHRKGRDNLADRKFPPHPKRKLTADEVLAIRASGESLDALSRRFGLWKRAIHNIKKGVTYRDVIAPTRRAS